MGVLVAVSAEKTSIKEGKTTRLIQLEVVDESGKINIALFGKYVDVINDFMTNEGNELPILAIQFAKLKTYKGDVVVHDVMNTSRVI